MTEPSHPFDPPFDWTPTQALAVCQAIDLIRHQLRCFYDAVGPCRLPERKLSGPGSAQRVLSNRTPKHRLKRPIRWTPEQASAFLEAIDFIDYQLKLVYAEGRRQALIQQSQHPESLQLPIDFHHDYGVP